MCLNPFADVSFVCLVFDGARRKLWKKDGRPQTVIIYLMTTPCLDTCGNSAVCSGLSFASLALCGARPKRWKNEGLGKKKVCEVAAVQCEPRAKATVTNFGALPSVPQTAIKPTMCDNGLCMLLFLHVLRKHVGRACVAKTLRSAACRFKRACAVEGGEAIGPARAWEAIKP